MRTHRRTASAAVLLTALAVTGCGGKDAASGGAAPSAAERGTSPLANPDGTKPGLASLASDTDRKAGLDLISRVKTAEPGPQTGYDRDKFGPSWTDDVDGIPLGHNNCDTRNDLLARDGKSVERKDGSDCTVTAMTIWDPYTGKTVQWTKQKASAIQIDHVMPLSYDWKQGAAAWDKARRVQIANDPLNLLPVDGSQNSSKGDKGPAEWLPASPEIRCAYAVRFAQVALKYDLPVTPADRTAMRQQCGG
ncbi:HNH endonuclease family protein [Kitasatospora sp. NPDC004799]|uniref:HNH endonuclease family protein n=1 Tax=Kitasatospora sp. NPDC004799 TaxID=3154460 RepID=UPI0033A9525B